MTVRTIIGNESINDRHLLSSSNGCIKSLYFTCLAMYPIKDKNIPPRTAMLAWLSNLVQGGGMFGDVSDDAKVGDFFARTC